MIEAPKHTPGPWVALKNSRNIHQVAAWICTIGNNPGDPAVFSTVFDTEKKYVFGDKLADAHLIAAAPEMLEIHQNSVEILEIVLEEREAVNGEEDEILRDLISRVRDVIAKAEGRS